VAAALIVEYGDVDLPAELAGRVVPCPEPGDPYMIGAACSPVARFRAGEVYVPYPSPGVE